MQHPFVLNLIPTSANDELASVAVVAPSPTKSGSGYTIDAPTIETQVVQLRRDGLSIAKIVQTTGLPERRVKALIKGVPMGISTPFDKSVSRTYDLACRPQGIKDYELRSILHQEYGCKWDTSEGCYHSNFDADVIKRVKERVRQRASKENSNVIFVMDWVDETAPTGSRLFLEESALNLMCRIDECINQFMELHGARAAEDSEDADLAQRKQAFAARRHILKIVSGLGPEPVARLLVRTTAVTNSLDGVPDMSCPKVPDSQDEYFPEPSHNDPFLEYVESQGWLG